VQSLATHPSAHLKLGRVTLIWVVVHHAHPVEVEQRKLRLIIKLGMAGAGAIGWQMSAGGQNLR